MTQRALYFPYIKTPDDVWFTRALLYWDQIGTIVPGGLETDERYVTPRMRELLDAGLLALIPPDAYLWQVRDFERIFLDFLERDAIVQARRGRLGELQPVQVHVGKLGELDRELTRLGLARGVQGPGREIWLEVEPRTADLFMAYLAATLGALEDLEMDPLTNRSQAMAALLGADTTRSVTLKVARELRLPVLEALLPAPAGDIAIAELRRFKERHGEELTTFRRHVEAALIDVANIAEDDARAARAALLTEELVTERDRLSAEMRSRRWHRIAFGAVGAVFAAGAAVVAPLVVGGGAAAAAMAMAAPGLIPAVYEAVEKIRKRPDFGRRPIAFAALAQRKLQA